MLALAQVCDTGGRLLGVTYLLFGGDSQLVTAVALRFETLTAVFRAVSDDDTLVARIGPVTAEADEAATDVSCSAPWVDCVGKSLSWAWSLTNQQGYTDGVRLEFYELNAVDFVVIELVTVASGIQVFVSRQEVPI